MSHVRFATAGQFPNGFSNMDRAAATAEIVVADSTPLFCGFVAPVSMTASYLGIYTTETTAATLVRFGIYSLDDSNNATLLTSLGALRSTIANAGYYKLSLPAGGITVAANATYAVCVVPQGNAVTVGGSSASLTFSGTETPYFALVSSTGGIISPPATFAPTSGTATGGAFYVELLQ